MIKAHYKSITKKTYNLSAKDYAARDRKIITETADVIIALNKFIRLLPKQARVLDLGSGTGRDSRFLFERSFRVVGIDFSKNMIQEAKKINPLIDYRMMDLERIKFGKNSFNGIWANASLHHIPKVHLKKIIKNIYNILKDGGIFFIKIKSGAGEGIRENKKFNKQLKRYFAFYSIKELTDLLGAAKFNIIFKKISKNKEWIDIFARK